MSYPPPADYAPAGSALFRELNSHAQLEEAFDRLFPLCRSILGEGYRRSFEILREYLPLEEESFESGQRVLNWTVPPEWVIREAYLEDDTGRRVCDFKRNCLEVVNYSMPYEGTLTFEELRPHLYYSPQPELYDAIPYVTSYYQDNWGFCLSRRTFESLNTQGRYHVHIDAEKIKGRLVTGQCLLPGRSEREILLSSYLCHPAMANNELSGPLTLALLYQKIAAWAERKYSYRFVINPETIGSIAYLSRHGENLREKLRAGLVLTCLGGEMSALRIKSSRRGDAPFETLCRCVEAGLVERDGMGAFDIEDFNPSSGSDERQYCSPGFNLPVAQVARLVYLTYKEYHTSLDTKEVMGIEQVRESAERLEALLKALERERFYRSTQPLGEVKLGDYNLYPAVNDTGATVVKEQGAVSKSEFMQAVMAVLNAADGEHSLNYTALRYRLRPQAVQQAAQALAERGLICEC